MWAQIRLCHKMRQILIKTVLLMPHKPYLADFVLGQSRILELDSINSTLSENLPHLMAKSYLDSQI